MKHKGWDEVFAARFERHADELKWLYCELYNTDMQAYDYFVDMLYRAWQARPEALRALDAEREAKPDWYRGRDRTGMLMYVKAFAGTLNGVREKLDYIQDCGVNYLHLIRKTDAELTAVSQKTLKIRQIMRCRDDQYILDPRQHQRAQRIIDHRFVINRQKLLRCYFGQRVQTRTAASRKYDSFHNNLPKTTTIIS